MKYCKVVCCKGNVMCSFVKWGFGNAVCCKGKVLYSCVVYELYLRNIVK